MKKIAFIFPGQGSQVIGMGQDLYNNFDSAKKVFDLADKTLNKSITKLCFDGPEEDLKQTQNTQPAIVATSIAALETFKTQLNITPSFVAGHSLGEYCALYEAGVFSLENIFKLIQKRADLMSQNKGGAMAAVLNAEESLVKECLKEASEDGYIDIANYNSPSQIVITGEENAVKSTCEILTKNGIKRVIPLAVSGAFHSHLMKSASEYFEDFIQQIDENEAKIPVITNIDFEVTTKNFKPKMVKQIYSSVYWYQSIEKMINNGVEIFIEFGSGKVLAGLNRKINSEITTFNVSDTNSLNETIQNLKEIINE